MADYTPPLSQAHSHLQVNIGEAEAHLWPPLPVSPQPRPQITPAHQLQPAFPRQRESQMYPEYRHMPLRPERPHDRNCANRMEKLHRYYDERKMKVMEDYEAGKERCERQREIRMEGAQKIQNRANMIKYKDSINFSWRDANDLNEHKKNLALQKIEGNRQQAMIRALENFRYDELRRVLRRREEMRRVLRRREEMEIRNLLRRREEVEDEPLPLYESPLPKYEEVVGGMGRNQRLMVMLWLMRVEEAEGLGGDEGVYVEWRSIEEAGEERLVDS